MKKPIAFSGRVESVDLKLQAVEIKHGPIPTFMPAMTMDCPIDNKAFLEQLKPGDKSPRPFTSEIQGCTM